MTAPIVKADGWLALRRLTPARIALGRSGASVPTAAQLAFQLDHARARDAVHAALDAGELARALMPPLSPTYASLPATAPLHVHSAARDRLQYLQRPDLGRRLDADSRAALDASRPAGGADLVIVIADGLSALAVARHAPPFVQALDALLARRHAGEAPWRVAPLVIAQQARVALGDDVAERLHARAVLVLIGERPGLSSPDSMGLYLSWAPRVGMRDAERNCISNVRPAGLAVEAAAARLVYLLGQARLLGMSGVALKDESNIGGGTTTAAIGPAGNG